MTLSEQIIRRVRGDNSNSKTEETKVDLTNTISTGSTLLDLSISGGITKEGGIPGGVMVEVFGPNQSGKTVLLCEIAGNIQRKGGRICFADPEGRLDKQYSQLFGLKIKEANYSMPDTVTEVFTAIRNWNPPMKENIINGIFTDSLAALSTELEMKEDEGDKMGMRRAKEFSQELRRTCRMLKQKNYLLVCSNQIRDTTDGYSRYESPGGKAIGFYSSIRLRTDIIRKIKKTKKINEKEVTRVIGVDIEVEVVKNSIWKPYHIAPVSILFDYGIDDIRQNLQFIKDYTKDTVYSLGERKLAKSIEGAIHIVESEGLEQQLRKEVIELWNEIENKFVDSERKLKWRW